jgi:hypothetical protein
MYYTFVASEAITEGYGCVVSGAVPGGAVELVDAADECNGVACESCDSGDHVTVCMWGEVDVHMDDTTAAHATVKCGTDAKWDASDANNAQATLRTGGATGLQRAFFEGKVRILAPST